MVQGHHPRGAVELLHELSFSPSSSILSACVGHARAFREPIQPPTLLLSSQESYVGLSKYLEEVIGCGNIYPPGIFYGEGRQCRNA